jgi:nucleoid-associated protein YgaU
MSRGIMRTTRPYAVWLGVTTVAATAATSVPDAWGDAASATASDRTADVLVAGCATMLALSLGWLWLVTSVTVAEVVAGRAPRGGGATRRLVLLACGAAVVAGTALPAQAASARDGAELLVGLPLPERAVAPATDPATPTVQVSHPTTDEVYEVRAGDSLWSIARAHPAPGDGVEARWRAIWRHNHDVVGDDPDLIHPGQALRLPATDTEKDGEPR